MLIQKSIKQPVDKYKNKDEDEHDDDNSKSVVKATTRTSSRNSTRTFVTASAAAAAAAITTIANPIDDYRIKREKNNESVRKSRAKNRVKVQECAERVRELKDESIQLNTKLSGLQSELSTLRSLFQYCFSFNTNQMPFKPSEVPTSTLYKIIMQNKTKFMQPVTNSNLTETIQQANYAALPQPPAIMMQTNEEKSQTAAVAVVQFDDDKDSFFINELKQSLIDFIKYDDSASTSNPSTTVSSPASPFTSSSSNDYLAENDVIIENDERFLKFLDDHDYSIKRVKLNI